MVSCWTSFQLYEKENDENYLHILGVDFCSQLLLELHNYSFDMYS